MHKTPEITRLIQENLWIVLSYALAQPAARELVRNNFRGDWKYIDAMIFEHAEIRADRALLEMATQLRVLDDAQNIDEYLKQINPFPFGTVLQANGEETNLYFRDVTNKILHASRFEWDLSEDPSVICYPHDEGRWKEATIRLVAVLALVGQLKV